MPDEAADNDAFLTKYSDLELLEKILPQDSLELSPDVETTEKGKKKERNNPTVRETIWLRSIDGLHSVVIYIDSVASDDQAYCYKHSSAIEI